MQKTRSSMIVCVLFFISSATAQSMQHFSMYEDVNMTIDAPANFSPSHKTIIILYALPNGNTTEQTMGKKIATGEDWHFDKQNTIIIKLRFSI